MIKQIKYFIKKLIEEFAPSKLTLLLIIYGYTQTLSLSYSMEQVLSADEVTVMALATSLTNNAVKIESIDHGKTIAINRFNSLPHDVMGKILRNLKPLDVIRLSLTNQQSSQFCKIFEPIHVKQLTLLLATSSTQSSQQALQYFGLDVAPTYRNLCKFLSHVVNATNDPWCTIGLCNEAGLLFNLDYQKFHRIITNFAENKYKLEYRYHDLRLVPITIGQLQHLRYLDLSHNKLTSLPAEIGQLTALLHFNISHNHLTQLPEAIWQLTLLKELNISGNNLTTLSNDIVKLQKLQDLCIEYTKIKELPISLAEIPTLTALYIAYTHVTKLPYELKHLKKLKVHPPTSFKKGPTLKNKLKQLRYKFSRFDNSKD